MRPTPRRALLLLLLLALLATSGLATSDYSAASPPAAPASVASTGPGPVSAGGGYVLSMADVSVAGALTGGGYQLTGASSPSAEGSGCCCLVNLPCVRRKP